MIPLKLFSFFHLNLAYSAIEEEQRVTVIERCYWPLLRLAEKHGLSFGIELSGYTLETIDAIDPRWTMTLKKLLKSGQCDLIGCGYAQVIGPLVPAEVNAANFRLGMQVYERLLATRPKFALVNEQAYSAGLVSLYQEAGYDALIMEWDNPARGRREWNAEWRYLPQRACGQDDVSLPLVWNKSIAFQKFQRYVHGELELEEYLSYVHGHVGSGVRVFPLYGNDVEVFDFRPGRYMSEEPLHGDGEWQRIERLYEALKTDEMIELIPVREVLAQMTVSGAGNSLHLESAQQPVPVKKQDKYNIVRWAVTGRDDLYINTRCRQIYESIRSNPLVTDGDWRELCYLWSSDFRTHITEKRWDEYQERLEHTAAVWSMAAQQQTGFKVITGSSQQASNRYRISQQGHYLIIQGERLKVKLNAHRGLALDELIDLQQHDRPLCGTLHHGYFDDIAWGADFYSGHLVYQSPGCPKITDLRSVKPHWEVTDEGVRVQASISTPLGEIQKQWLINEDRCHVDLSYLLDWNDATIGSLRLGYMTLFPDAFDARSLVYRTHNGGRIIESFPFNGVEVDHGKAVSFLISSRQAVGMTEGVFEFSDGCRGISIKVNQGMASLVGLVTHQQINDKYFTRFELSAKEVDDTSRIGVLNRGKYEVRYYLPSMGVA